MIWFLIIVALVGLPFYIFFTFDICTQSYFENKMEYQKKFFENFDPTFDEQENV